MNLSFKDMKFMLEAVDNLIEKYQTRIYQIEDLDEYEDEVSDLGNDIMFLSSLRKKIDDSLNDSLKPNTTAILQFLKSSKSSRKERKARQIRVSTPKPPEPAIKASTNHPNAHIKSEFDDDK